jgi:hypothetical protein
MALAGWCRSEVVKLLDQKVGATCMYYLSTMNRHSLGWNHDACEEDFHCLHEKLDLNIYRTKHTLECQQTSKLVSYRRLSWYSV